MILKLSTEDLIQQRSLKTLRQKHEKSLQMKAKFRNRVENIIAKGEITDYEQFFLTQQCFQKSNAANS